MKEVKRDRLPDCVRPVLYEIALKVLPEEKTFSGSVQIDLRIDAPVREIILHSLDLNIGGVKFQEGESDPISVRIKKDLPSETICLSLKEPVPAGTARLFISFSGRLNRQMRGLYEAHAEGETYAFTQCEATDARRIFPCFDEPAMKARFRLSVCVPSNLTALSNMPVIEEKQDKIQSEGMKELVFDETPVMSTYLLALAVAKLEKEEIKIAGTLVAIWTLPGELHLGKFALEVTSSVLPLLNDYFDLPYPYPKLDLVCVPDFAMGAMENWGAIFFRDSCLLLDKDTASTTAQRRVANVLTHEIVHQWFGNLVTMEWWDDLWLNESFATWLACKIVDQWRPEWHSWVEFQQEKEIPLALDALESTRPIRASVASSAQIEEMFDALTYEKGAACLRMVEQFLGEETFREGIRQYIKQYQYKNAPAEALWKALESASGQPVSAIATDWFTRPGFPLVTVKAGDGDLRELILTQKRFHASGQEEGNEGSRWTIPFSLKYEDSDGTHVHRLLISDETTRCRLPGESEVRWVFGNAGESAYLRTDYDSRLRDKLQPVIAAQLTPSERIGILNHNWALSKNGALPISRFMEILFRFKGDKTRVVVEAMTGYLETLSHHLVLSGDRSAFVSLAKSLIFPVWKELGWDPASGESDDVRLARASALWVMGAIVQDVEILSELPRRQILYLAKRGSLDSTLATPLIRLCARTDGGTRFEQYLNKIKTSKTPEDRDRYLIALADFQKPALTRRVLDFVLSEDVRAQDSWRPIRALFANAVTQGETWKFVQGHWKELREKGGSVGAQRILQSTRSLWGQEWYGEVEAFFAAPENKLPSAERSLRQTLEFIQLGIRFKAQQTEDLSTWLRERKG
ncbi:MAG: M1 family metallopeptidase [Nitrospira sp.]|nr:M1 family peptidase [Candidatus Manganitrophaceae bacterium]HIL35625.1 M1 family peptidase [Candidatus Manganitrophaceae bacterium]